MSLSIDTPDSSAPRRRKKRGDALAPLAVSPAGAAQLLGYGISKTNALIRTGELVSYKDGKSRRVPVASIKARIARLVAAEQQKAGAATSDQPSNKASAND